MEKPKIGMWGKGLIKALFMKENNLLMQMKKKYWFISPSRFAQADLSLNFFFWKKKKN